MSESSEKEYNLAVLAVSLGLQMLGTGVEINSGQLLSLKLSIAKLLGFDCAVQLPAKVQLQSISRFDCKNQQQLTLFICLCRGLKRVFDKYHVNLIIQDDCDSDDDDDVSNNQVSNNDNTSNDDNMWRKKEAYMFFFFDILTLAVANPANFSAMDLTAAKSWLDVILVFIYKVRYLK